MCLCVWGGVEFNVFNRHCTITCARLLHRRGETWLSHLNIFPVVFMLSCPYRVAGGSGAFTSADALATFPHLSAPRQVSAITPEMTYCHPAPRLNECLAVLMSPFCSEFWLTNHVPQTLQTNACYKRTPSK